MFAVFKLWKRREDAQDLGKHPRRFRLLQLVLNYQAHCKMLKTTDQHVADGPLWVKNKDELRPHVKTPSMLSLDGILANLAVAGKDSTR